MWNKIKKSITLQNVLSVLIHLQWYFIIVISMVIDEPLTTSYFVLILISFGLIISHYVFLLINSMLDLYLEMEVEMTKIDLDTKKEEFKLLKTRHDILIKKLDLLELTAENILKTQTLDLVTKKDKKE